MEMEPATAGDSIFQATLSPVITGLNHDQRLPWGSRPRLYAYACVRRLPDFLRKAAAERPKHKAQGEAKRNPG